MPDPNQEAAVPRADHIDDNRKGIASLKKGDKLGYAGPDRRKKDGPGLALRRTAKDSITNAEGFLGPIKALFSEAVQARAR
jgi:hypothetical protein